MLPQTFHLLAFGFGQGRVVSDQIPGYEGFLVSSTSFWLLVPKNDSHSTHSLCLQLPDADETSCVLLYSSTSQRARSQSARTVDGKKGLESSASSGAIFHSDIQSDEA